MVAMSERYLIPNKKNLIVLSANEIGEGVKLRGWSHPCCKYSENSHPSDPH